MEKPRENAFIDLEHSEVEKSKVKRIKPGRAPELARDSSQELLASIPEYRQQEISESYAFAQSDVQRLDEFLGLPVDDEVPSEWCITKKSDTVSLSGHSRLDSVFDDKHGASYIFLSKTTAENLSTDDLRQGFGHELHHQTSYVEMISHPDGTRELQIGLEKRKAEPYDPTKLSSAEYTSITRRIENSKQDGAYTIQGLLIAFNDAIRLDLSGNRKAQIYLQHMVRQAIAPGTLSAESIVQEWQDWQTDSGEAYIRGATGEFIYSEQDDLRYSYRLNESVTELLSQVGKHLDTETLEDESFIPHIRIGDKSFNQQDLIGKSNYQREVKTHLAIMNALGAESSLEYLRTMREAEKLGSVSHIIRFLSQHDIFIMDDSDLISMNSSSIEKALLGKEQSDASQRELQLRAEELKRLIHKSVD